MDFPRAINKTSMSQGNDDSHRPPKIDLIGGHINSDVIKKKVLKSES